MKVEKGKERRYYATREIWNPSNRLMFSQKVVNLRKIKMIKIQI